MTRITRWLTAIALLAPVAAANAACEAPEEPNTLPDGETATKKEMLAGQQVVKEYMEEAQAYVDCIDLAEEREMKNIMELEPDVRKHRVDELNEKRRDRNAVVEQMQSTAARFNTELDEYQARQTDDS